MGWDMVFRPTTYDLRHLCAVRQFDGLTPFQRVYFSIISLLVLLNVP